MSTLAESYREAMRARVASSPPPSPYDVVLAGLVAAFAARKVETSADELSVLFHWPLATMPTSAPLAQVAAGMFDALPTEAGRQPIVGPHLYTTYTPAKNETSIRNQLSWLDPESKEILKHAADTRAEAAKVRRMADLCEELLPECDDDGEALAALAGALRRAELLDAAASDAEEWVETTRGVLEARLSELPVERAKSVRPISELRLRPAVFGSKYGGNLGEPGALVSDGCLVFDSSKVVGAAAKRRAERLAVLLIEVKFTQDRLSEILRDTDNEKPARVVGFVPHEASRGSTRLLAVVLIDEAEVIYADADYVRLLDSLFGGKLSVRVHQDSKNRKMIVFYLRGAVVAVLAPMSHEIPIDVETLRGMGR